MPLKHEPGSSSASLGEGLSKGRPQVPLSSTFLKHIKKTQGRGGGVRVIFLGLKFWPKVIFGSMKVAGIFWVAKKTRGFIGGCEKRIKVFFGYAKRSSDFFR